MFSSIGMILKQVGWVILKEVVVEILEHTLDEVKATPEKTPITEAKVRKIIKEVKHTKKVKDFNRRRSNR